MTFNWPFFNIYCQSNFELFITYFVVNLSKLFKKFQIFKMLISIWSSVALRLQNRRTQLISILVWYTWSIIKWRISRDSVGNLIWKMPFRYRENCFFIIGSSRPRDHYCWNYTYHGDIKWGLRNPLVLLFDLHLIGILVTDNSVSNGYFECGCLLSACRTCDRFCQCYMSIIYFLSNYKFTSWHIQFQIVFSLLLQRRHKQYYRECS